MSSGKSTRFFYIFILTLVVGGIFLFLSKFKLFNIGLIASDARLFTLDELCELLSMEPDKKAEFLLEKGFVEYDCDSTCIKYTMESKGVEVFGIIEGANFYYAVFFDLAHKDVYTSLINQINKPTLYSTKKDKEGNTDYYYRIGEKCLLGDSGWERKDQNYQITIMDDFIFQKEYNSKALPEK